MRSRSSIQRFKNQSVQGEVVRAKSCEYPVAESGGLSRTDVREHNCELRRELHLSRRAPGYFVPIELAHGSSTLDSAVEQHLRVVK